MFSLDDNTGNVVSTVALFLVAVTVLYVARRAFFILYCIFCLLICSNPPSRGYNSIRGWARGIAVGQLHRCT